MRMVAYSLAGVGPVPRRPPKRTRPWHRGSRQPVEGGTIAAMVMKPDYTADAVAAAKSVMLELFHLLGEYRDDIILIGGWVPALLVSGGEDPHVGSLDVDIALDHRKCAAGAQKGRLT